MTMMMRMTSTASLASLLLLVVVMALLFLATTTKTFFSSSSSSSSSSLLLPLDFDDIFQKMKSTIFYDQTGQTAPTKSIKRIKIHGDSRDSDLFETDDVAPMTEEEVAESFWRQKHEREKKREKRGKKRNQR
jgi:hypothetical protein